MNNIAYWPLLGLKRMLDASNLHGLPLRKQVLLNYRERDIDLNLILVQLRAKKILSLQADNSERHTIIWPRAPHVHRNSDNKSCHLLALGRENHSICLK